MRLFGAPRKDLRPFLTLSRRCRRTIDPYGRVGAIGCRDSPRNRSLRPMSLPAPAALDGVSRVDGDDLTVEICSRHGAWRRRFGAERLRCANPGAEREQGGEKNEGALFGWCRHARRSRGTVDLNSSKHLAARPKLARGALKR